LCELCKLIVWIECVWNDTYICLWLVHMCRMPHLCVCHDSCIRVIWRIHVHDMTRATLAHVWDHSFTGVAWLIHMCDMCDVTHSWLYSSTHSLHRHKSARIAKNYICVTCVTWLIRCRCLSAKEPLIIIELTFEHLHASNYHLVAGVFPQKSHYWVVTICRLLQILGLLCRI